MKLLQLITLLALIALTYFMGDTFFYRKSLSYENGRHFNEPALTVYNEQAVTVYFLLFLLASFVTIFVAYSLLKNKKVVHDAKV